MASRRYDWRAKVLAGAAAFVLLAGGTLAHWQVKTDEVLIARNVPPSPVKNISTASASARDLADIPPEAFHPQPPMAGGYNAHSGGLPPGALPPGVVLPGMPMAQGGRMTAQGYGLYDGVRQQFTGKERDTETGLDYFGARYYSPTQGRFTSVDPENASADPEDPQSWNGYAYARNNPLKYVDPDGREYKICETNGKCYRHWDPEWKPLFDPKNAQAVGIVLKGNRDSGVILNADGEQIGTYRFIGQDYWSDFQNGVVQQLRNPETYVRALPPAILNTITHRATTSASQGAKWAPGLQKYRHGNMTAIEHVFYRHGPQSGFSRVSKFAPGTSLRDVKNMVDEAVAGAGAVRSGNSIVYDFGRVIGTNPKGLPTTKIKIYLNSAGEVRTAFPF